MALDIRAIYDDFNIDWRDSGKEVTKGWINSQCPFCGDTSEHLGYFPQLDMFSCWKCGIHPVVQTLSKILEIPFGEVIKLTGSYKDYDVTEIIQPKGNWKKKVILPPNYGTLKKSHRRYLHGRGFDPIKAKNQFGLVGTGRDGQYSRRIIFPIYYKGKLVSYHSRDVTDKHSIKAMACNSDDEAIRHKEVLYNFDNITNVGVLSEAPLDAIKWGYDIGLASFGIKITEQQIELLKTIPHLFVAYDSGPGEEVAQKQARRIADLVGIYRPVHVIDELGCDPAELSEDRVKRIRAEIFKIVRNESC